VPAGLVLLGAFTQHSSAELFSAIFSRPSGVCVIAGVDRSETGLVAVGGSPLLEQGEATLQRRGKSPTSINRALAPASRGRPPAAKAGGE
jgi:hypothetical protein